MFCIDWVSQWINLVVVVWRIYRRERGRAEEDVQQVDQRAADVVQATPTRVTWPVDHRQWPLWGPAGRHAPAHTAADSHRHSTCQSTSRL